jgi:hypothetical protein
MTPLLKTYNFDVNRIVSMDSGERGPGSRMRGHAAAQGGHDYQLVRRRRCSRRHRWAVQDVGIREFRTTCRPATETFYSQPLLVPYGRLVPTVSIS